MAISQLGIEVHSEDANKGAVNLDRLAKAAVEGEGAVKRLGAASKTADTATGMLAREAERVANSVRQEASAANTAAEAQRRAAAATEQHNVALREQGNVVRLNRFNTANIAAQFQDIGITAAMGQSPLTIALQQGTQLSAALGNQGLRGTVLSLGAAFASVISPVSLLTIAIIGLGTAGVQQLFSMMNATDDATSALEEHRKWLDEILVGYDDARDAAQQVADVADRLPKGVVQSDLRADQAKGLGEYNRLAREATRLQEDLNYKLQQWNELRAESARLYPDDVGRQERFAGLIQSVQDLIDLQVNADSSPAAIDRALESTKELLNTADRPEIRKFAQEVYDMANAMRQANSVIAETEAAIRSLQGTPFRGLGLEDAFSELQRMTPDLRSTRDRALDRASDVFAQNIAQARTTSEVNALVDAYDRLNAALDEQDRRREELSNSRKGSKAFDQWGESLESMRERIAQTHLEADALSMTAEQADRARTEFELLNQAKRANVQITPELTEEVSKLAAEYAAAQEQLRQMTAEQQHMAEEFKFYQGVWTDFFVSVGQKIRETGDFFGALKDSALDALGSIADRMIQLAASQAFNALFGSFFNPFGPNGGLPINLLGAANGNVFGSGDVIPFADGGVVSNPSYFPMRGKMGLMGEAGPEAVMPLKRGPDGKLGVAAANQNGGDINVSIHVDARGAQDGVGVEIAKQLDHFSRFTLPDRIRQVQANPYRKG